MKVVPVDEKCTVPPALERDAQVLEHAGLGAGPRAAGYLLQLAARQDQAHPTHRAHVAFFVTGKSP
jgi:TPP-dependent pyruvate/acetoin dehydrogenase alpha subunit